MEFPRWMYHKEAPKGVLFLSQKELDNACEGWVDSPAFLHSVPDATGSTEDIESIFDRAQKEKERGEIHDLEEIEKPVPVKRGPGRPRKVTDANLYTA